MTMEKAIVLKMEKAIALNQSQRVEILDGFQQKYGTGSAMTLKNSKSVKNVTNAWYCTKNGDAAVIGMAGIVHSSITALPTAQKTINALWQPVTTV